MPQTGSSAALSKSKKQKSGETKLEKLSRKLRRAISQSPLEHIARAGGIAPSIVQGVADGTHTPTAIETKHLERGLACYNADDEQ